MRNILIALMVLAGCKQEKAEEAERVRTEPGQKKPERADEKMPEIETVEVVPGISMLVGAGGNIAVVKGTTGSLIIDDQLKPAAEQVKAAAEKAGGTVRVVVNTHWHGDHTGGNELLGGQGAVIVAHENVRTRMSTEQVNEKLDRTTPPSPEAALPVVTFAEEVRLHWGGQELHAIHVPPAHTDGDTVIHFPKANVIHTGDTYFAGMFPFIDIWSGGSVDGVIAAADVILAKADAGTKIIPGHGPLSNRAELETWRAMLVTVRDRVRAMVAGKKSDKEILAARPSREWDDTHGTGFMNPETFISILIEDARRKR